MSGNLTLEQIFDRTESMEYSKNFHYIEQTPINGKPSIIAGNEKLINIPLKIKLHHSFCNPQKIIDEIEEKAKNREIINYFQNGKYIGNYVINKYTVDIKQKIENLIIFAEIYVNLLEKTQNINTYQQQNTNLTNIKIAANSGLMKKLLSKSNAQLLTNTFDLVISNLTNQNSTLSPKAKKILNTLQTDIIKSIQKNGLVNTHRIVTEYMENLNMQNKISQTEIYQIKDNLSLIPSKILNAVLRNI